MSFERRLPGSRLSSVACVRLSVCLCRSVSTASANIALCGANTRDSPSYLSPPDVVITFTYDRYDTIQYIYVRSKADEMASLSLVHGREKEKIGKN